MEINIYTLMLAMIIPISIAIVARLRDKYLSNEVIYSSLTMTIQLSISAVILTFVFSKQNIIITVLYLVVMMAFSFKTLKKRVDKNFKLINSAKVSIICSSIIILVFLISILSLSKNVFTPRYIIPLYGMLLGNTTTATILASNQINDILTNNKNAILTLTSLGVPIKNALEEQLNKFVSVALTPTLASMLNIGIVALPGMMTGQILAGEVPTTAVSYQLMIMFCILGSITLSVFMLKYLTVNKSINKFNQLK